MITGIKLAVAIAAMSLTTLFTRAFPFIVFGGASRKPPAVVTYLGHFLPPAIICCIIVYCFRDVPLFAPPYAYREAISVAAVAGLYLWTRSPVISIFAGTGVYMLLVQFVR